MQDDDVSHKKMVHDKALDEDDDEDDEDEYGDEDSEVRILDI
jgi:hypothetical protein